MHDDLRGAARGTVPVGAGTFLLGASFGLVVVGLGLAWWWTPIFSGIVFAGSVEFLLVALADVGTPLLPIALTSLLVNARHAFYGLPFPLERIPGRLGRAYAVFALTDEAYALACRPGPLPPDGASSEVRSSCKLPGSAAESWARWPPTTSPCACRDCLIFGVTGPDAPGVSRGEDQR